MSGIGLNSQSAERPSSVAMGALQCQLRRPKRPRRSRQDFGERALRGSRNNPQLHSRHPVICPAQHHPLFVITALPVVPISGIYSLLTVAASADKHPRLASPVPSRAPDVPTEGMRGVRRGQPCRLVSCPVPLRCRHCFPASYYCQHSGPSASVPLVYRQRPPPPDAGCH